MTLKDIFTIYWPQTTIFLFALSYFIKRVLDNRSKKIEINHTIFQQKRLEALHAFIKIYSENEHLWNLLPIYEILRHEINPKGIDKLVFPTLNSLKSNVLELQIYFEKEDYKLFNEILSNVENINEKLLLLWSETSVEYNTTHKANEFYHIRDTAFSKNKVLFEKVNSLVKKNFK